MHKKLNVLSFILVLCYFLLAVPSCAQQLKLGNNPTQIEKSAVLQLDRKNQGLLLPRISDTNDISTPKDGMIIYFTDTTGQTSPGENDGVYVRKNGYWYRQSKSFKVEDESTIDFYYDNNDTIVLHMPDASSGISGLIGSSSIHQTFKGDKAFHDPLIADSVVYVNNLIIDNVKNTGDTAFLTTDNNGKVILANMDKGYWKVGGSYIADDSKAKIGKTYQADMDIITGNEKRIHITSSGRVGIGTSSPTETMDVNGSFKLGKGGNSFEIMGEGEFTVTFDKHTLISLGTLGGLLSRNFGYQIDTVLINGIKKNAMVYINPQQSLILTVPIIGILGKLLSGTLYENIAWVRALNGSIEICFYWEASFLLDLLDSPTTASFNVFFCNAK